jgi:hypothetical protein
VSFDAGSTNAALLFVVLSQFWYVGVAGLLLIGVLVGWLIRGGRRPANPIHEEARRVADEQQWLAQKRDAGEKKKPS